MKKIISLALAALLSAAMFAGCSSSSKMKDGKYRAEYSEPDSHGWTEYVEVTVSGEKITDVDFDAVNTEGVKKSEDASYDEAMKNAGWTIGPKDFYADLEKQLIDKQNVNDIDGVATATTSSNSLKTLMTELQKNIAKGDTATVKVAQPESSK